MVVKEFDNWLNEQVNNLRKFQLETFPQHIIEIIDN